MKKPKAARNIAATEIEKVRMRNRPSGTIGSATRDSIHTKIAANTRPIRMSPPTVGSAQPLATSAPFSRWVPPLFVRPMRNGAMASANTSAPM